MILARLVYNEQIAKRNSTNKNPWSVDMRYHETRLDMVLTSQQQQQQMWPCFP